MEVSVVVPVFNRSETVCRAIVSALRQAYPVSEVIVIDDASTDASVQVIQSIGDPRIRLVMMERNRGASVARNEGIDLAIGDLVCFLDSDDAWTKNHVSKVVDMFSNGADVVLSGATVIRDGCEVKSQTVPRDCLVSSADVLLRRQGPAQTSCLSVRRDVIDRGIRFSPGLRSLEDYEFVLRCSLAGYRVLRSSQRTVLRHSSGGDHLYNPLAAAEATFRIMDEFSLELNEIAGAFEAHYRRLARYVLQSRKSDPRWDLLSASLEFGHVSLVERFIVRASSICGSRIGDRMMAAWERVVRLLDRSASVVGGRGWGQWL